MTQIDEHPPEPWQIPTREPSAVITEHPDWCTREEEPGWDAVGETFDIFHVSRPLATFTFRGEMAEELEGRVTVERFVDEDVQGQTWPAPLVHVFGYDLRPEETRKLRDGLTAALEVIDGSHPATPLSAASPRRVHLSADQQRDYAMTTVAHTSDEVVLLVPRRWRWLSLLVGRRRWAEATAD